MLGVSLSGLKDSALPLIYIFIILLNIQVIINFYGRTIVGFAEAQYYSIIYKY